MPDQPGCLREIQGKAISDRIAKLLPKHCQKFRNDYIEGLEQLSKAPEKLSAKLKKAIEASKGVKAPYTSLLIAVLSQSPEQDQVILPAIEKRAALEKKLNVLYLYSQAALERIKTGSCQSFTDPMYSEICGARDPAYSRIVALNRNTQEQKKK